MKIIGLLLAWGKIGWPIAKAIAAALQDGVITRQEAQVIAEQVLDTLVGDDDQIVVWSRGSTKKS